MYSTQTEVGRVNDDIMVDPSGLAQIANTLGGSLDAADLTDAPCPAECGSVAVASVLERFADGLSSAVSGLQHGFRRTGTDILATANDFSGLDENFAATFTLIELY